MSMPTILTFFIILLVLVIVHEFGHFIVAKLFKMRVDEFAFGFPPRLFSFKKGETEYSFNALPLGGYVRIFGENGEETASEEDLKRAFNRQKKYKQILVLVAGVAMNIFLAWILLSITYVLGTQTAENDRFTSEMLSNKKVLVSDVMKGAPAEAAGLQQLDQIVSVQTSTESLQVTSSDDLPNFVSRNQDSEITITYLRDGITQQAVMSPAAGIVQDKKIIGLSSGLIGEVRLPIIDAFIVGAQTTYQYTILTFQGFFDLIAKLFKGEGKEAAAALTGPVGIVGLVGDAQDSGLAALLGFTALISINLAVLNILPLPALDGGRIVFVLIETVIRRPLSFAFQNAVNGVSFILLLLLMVFITYKDIIKLF
jgi:regulator of sigma E protease